MSDDFGGIHIIEIFSIWAVLITCRLKWHEAWSRAKRTGRDRPIFFKNTLWNHSEKSSLSMKPDGVHPYAQSWGIIFTSRVVGMFFAKMMKGAKHLPAAFTV